MWTSSTSTVQYLTLLPPSFYGGNSNLFYPTYTTFQLDSSGISFTVWPPLSGTGSNLINLSVNPVNATYYSESNFLSGTLSVIPSSTCYSYATLQAAYYGVVQRANLSFMVVVSNASRSVTVTGSMVVNVGVGVTSADDQRPMYQVMAISGQRSVRNLGAGGSPVITNITGLVNGGGYANLIYLPTTDFVTVSSTASMPLDAYGLTYSAGGRQYTLSKNSSALIKEVDNAVNDEVAFVGSSTLCAGVACPLAYPLQLCLQSSAVDTTGVYGANRTVTSSLLVTATVQSNGVVRSLQGVRVVTANFNSSGSPSTFVQLVSLLPPGSVNGSTNLLLMQAPYLDVYGLAFFTTPASFSLSNGTILLRLASASSPNITEDWTTAMVAPALNVTMGACVNQSKWTWFYPSPAPIPVLLSYTFAYPVSNATIIGIVEQVNLTLHIDGSGSVMPPTSSLLSQGFNVLDCTGVRTTWNYSVGMKTMRIDQVTSLLAAGSFDGFFNPNLLFLLPADQSAFGLGFNTTGSYETGTAGGIGGAVAVRWNATQQQFQEVTSAALGSVLQSINQTGNDSAPAGLSSACVTGSFIDSAGQFGYTHIAYSLTLLYNCSLTGVDSRGQWYTVVSVRGTRTAHGVVNSTNFVNLLPSTALSNDNRLYPSLSVPFFSGAGIAFTPDQQTTTMYGSAGLALGYNASTTLYSESTVSIGGLTGALSIIPGATCPGYASLNTAYYLPPQPLILDFSVRFTQGSTAGVVNGSFVVDVSRLVLSLAGQQGYPVLSAIATSYNFTVVTVAGHSVWVLSSVAPVALLPPYSSNGTFNNFLYLPQVPSPSSPGFSLSSNASGYIDIFGLGLGGGALPTLVVQGAGLQYLVLQQGQTMEASLCLMTIAAQQLPSSLCVQPPSLLAASSSSSSTSARPASSSPFSSSASPSSSSPMMTVPTSLSSSLLSSSLQSSSFFSSSTSSSVSGPSSSPSSSSPSPSSPAATSAATPAATSSSLRSSSGWAASSSLSSSSLSSSSLSSSSLSSSSLSSSSLSSSSLSSTTPPPTWSSLLPSSTPSPSSSLIFSSPGSSTSSSAASPTAASTAAQTTSSPSTSSQSSSTSSVPSSSTSPSVTSTPQSSSWWQPSTSSDASTLSSYPSSSSVRTSSTSLWAMPTSISALWSSSLGPSITWSSSTSDSSSVAPSSSSGTAGLTSSIDAPTSSSASPTIGTGTPFVVSPAQGIAASTAFNFSVDKVAVLRLLGSDLTDPTLFAFPLVYVSMNSSASSASSIPLFSTSVSSSVLSVAVIAAEMASVDWVVVYLPAGWLLFSVCAQPVSASSAAVGGCVTYSTPLAVSLPYSANSTASVVSCYLSEAVQSVSSSSLSQGQLSVQSLSLLSALATTAVQSAASLTACPTSANSSEGGNSSAGGGGGGGGGSGSGTSASATSASVSSVILGILSNCTSALLSSASSTSPTAALSTATLVAQTLATLTSAYTNTSTTSTTSTSTSTSTTNSSSTTSALLTPSYSSLTLPAMTQHTFDTASALVSALLTAIQQVASTSSSNASASAGSLSSAAASAANTANTAVAAVLANLVQASQAALNALSSSTTTTPTTSTNSSSNSSQDTDTTQSSRTTQSTQTTPSTPSTQTALLTTCARFATSVAQVQQLVNATLQQLQASTTTAAPAGTSVAAQSLSTAAFTAQAYQLTADPTSNASVSLGGLGLTVPAAALASSIASNSAISVRVVQVSGEWAVCGQDLTGTQSELNDSSAASTAAAATPTLSSNIVTIDVVDAGGQTQSVSGLQQPIEFDLTASLPSGAESATNLSEWSAGANSSATLPTLLPRCSWFDPASLSWSTEGCNSSVSSVSSSAVTVHCACSHLTDFGIIYALSESAAEFDAITTGFAGYLVLLVVYIVLWLVTLMQLMRILNLTDSSWVAERWSRLRAPLMGSKDRATAVHSAHRVASLTSASKLVLLEHVLVLVITSCRACSMCILYRYDASVSFALLSGLSLLPLVMNEWVYGFVIFQWSAIYYNALRGGSVGDCDFSSSSMARLRVAFYASMTVVSVAVVGLYGGVVSTAQPGLAMSLAYAGIILTLCFIALLASLLFTLGLALVYSLTRDFASKHATKLFLIAATFSCTLLGQALTLMHQAEQPNSLLDNINTDNMFYYTLDAAGHLLVLFMFKRSVRNAAIERHKRHAHNADSVHSELRGPTISLRSPISHASSVGFSIRDKALTEAQMVRPSFLEEPKPNAKIGGRVGHSRSSSRGVSGIGSSHVQLTTVDGGVGYHTRVWSMEGSKGGAKAFSFQGEAVKGLRPASSESMLEMEALSGGDSWRPLASSDLSPKDEEVITTAAPASPLQGQVEADRERDRLFIHTRGRLVLPPLQNAPTSPQSAGVELQSSSRHRRDRSVAPLPISPRSAHSSLGRMTETAGNLDA